MGAEGQTALALAPPGDQQADHGEHRPGGTPCGLLPPYGGARRRGLAPATARCHGGGLLLRGLEPRGLRPDRRPDRRGPHCPPVVCVGRGQGRDCDHEAIACRRRGGGPAWRGVPAASAASGGGDSRPDDRPQGRGLPQADAAGEASSTTAPEAEKPLWAIIPAVFPVPGGGARAPPACVGRPPTPQRAPWSGYPGAAREAAWERPRAL